MSFIARVICWVDLTEAIRRRIALSDAIAENAQSGGGADGFCRSEGLHKSVQRFEQVFA
jgi:hypothetical protein